MNRKIKNRGLLKALFLALFMILIPFSTFATDTENEFSNLTVEIVIDENSTAKITETWEVAIYDGTEMYKPYYNMGTSEIQNFSVTDENGTEYEVLSKWDISLSQEEKKGKCGIYENSTTGGTELCWGIGDYGSHTYVISYEITNFVSYYSDEEVQKTYFTLVPNDMDPIPENVIMKISAGFDFTEDNVTVTGYGFTGDTTIDDGVILISTTSTLNSSQYVELLIEYEDEPFSVTDTVSGGDYRFNCNFY